MKAYKHAFAYYDSDDISQEIWISVQKAVGRFDPSRVNKRALQFFNVVTENALKNLKRDNRIIDNINIADRPILKEDRTDIEEIEANELYMHIYKRLPDNLKNPFEKMVKYGGEGVSSYLKSKVRTAVLSILGEV